MANRTTRFLWMLAGFVLTAFGIIGLALPVMPGTVFLILALGCFARSSPRFEHWLLHHPRFGPTLREWRASGAITPRIKATAVGMMAASLAAMALVHVAPQIILIAAIPMLGAAAYILTRPSGLTRR